MKKAIILNLKTYSTANAALDRARHAEAVARRTGREIIICPLALDLSAMAHRYSFARVFAQHADANDMGKGNGSIPMEAVKTHGAKGVVLNHSEKRLEFPVLAESVAKAKKFGLETIVCVQTPEEAIRAARLRPTGIAFEPPYLIGSATKSVTSEKPRIKRFIAILKGTGVKAIIGAGLRTAQDFRVSKEVGADGVFIARAFYDTKDPEKFIEDIVRDFN